MFERTKVDTFTREQQTAVPAEISLDDGRTLKGKFLVSASRPVFEVLNGPTAFVEFETYQGERELIAKAGIRAIKLVGIPDQGPVASRTVLNDDFNPYQILGVDRGADWDDIREAYHKLAKAYHPDRYAAAELPDEVQHYLSAMSRRVNAAYAALEQPKQVKARVDNRVKPVYERAAV